MDARTGTHIHNIIRTAHGILVVLHHDDRIAQVPQVFQGGNELVVVPLMEADGGLVQHIEHTGKGAADLGRQADALALAAGQSACRAGQGEIIQTDALQKLQPVFDLFENLAADLLLLLRQVRFIFRNEVQLIPDGHFAEIADVLATDGHRQHDGLEALAVAVRALHTGHEAADLLFHPLAVGLPEAAFQVLHDALKRIIVDAAAKLIGAVHFDFFAVGAVEQGVDRLGAHLLDGRVQRETVLFAKAQIIHLSHRALGIVPAAGLDGPLPDGEIAVGQDAFLIHPHESAQTCTLLAGTQRVVEREQAGRKVADGNAVLRAGKVLAERHALAADDIYLGDAARQRQSCLQRVRQTAPDALADGKTVHHDLHGVLDVLFQADLLVQIIEIAVDPGAGIAAPPGGVQLFLLGALALADDRSQHLELCPLFQLEHGVHHLVHGLLADDPAADRAVWDADAGIQQTEVIINFGHRAHRGTGVVAGGLLVDGNGRRQAGDLVHIGLIHPAQEHPGIAGKALDIAALAVGVNGIKGQAGLARAGQAGHDDELFPREGQADIFQVVLPGPFDDDFIVCQGIFSLFSVSVRGSASAPVRRTNLPWGSRPGAGGRSGHAGTPRAQTPTAWPPLSSPGSGGQWRPPAPACPFGGYSFWRSRPYR